MLRRAPLILLLAACGASSGPGAAPSSAPPPSGAAATGGGGGDASSRDTDDPRVVQLRTMTELLELLATEVEQITAAEPPSRARCERLADAVTAWGEAHYAAYETADGEGTYLGLRAGDADHAELRRLARTLARTSSLLVELVDQDCLYGSGRYGEVLYEYLVAYQGLAHWVQDGDPAAWDYETLIAADG